MTVSPADYPALKAFFIWMDRNVVEPSLGFASSAVAALEGLEAKQPAMARKGLAMALGDLVEMLDGLQPGQIKALDDTLEAENLPTFSAVRARFLSRVRTILKRGSVRTEADYHDLRNVAETLPENEKAEAWRLLAAYEERVAAR